MFNNARNLRSMLNKETVISGSILMIGHVFRNHYHTPRVQLFGGNFSTIKASLEHSILGAAAFNQQESAEWLATEGGSLPDPQQYQRTRPKHLV